jgi:hypothetical protein
MDGSRGSFVFTRMDENEALGEIFFFATCMRVQQEWVVSGTIVSELINLNMHN